MFKQLQEFLELSGYERAREDLSQAVINYILFSDSGFTSFEPGTISIPANMTVIWFNNDDDDDAEHSVMVNTGNSTIYLQEQCLIRI